MATEGAQRWVEAWDPSVYLPSAKMPMLWVNGAPTRSDLIFANEAHPHSIC